VADGTLAQEEKKAMSTQGFSRAQQAAGKIKLGLTRLAGKYPYHLKVLEQFQLRPRPDIDTMAVGVVNDQVLLWFNATFVLQTPLAQLLGVLLHETHHVVLGHVTVDRADFPDTWARVTAEEVTANEFVASPCRASRSC
jgi:hypothetical protein